MGFGGGVECQFLTFVLVVELNIGVEDKDRRSR